MAYEPRGDHGGGGQDAFVKVRGRSKYIFTAH